MEEHDAGRSLVHVLPAMTPGTDECLFEIRFSNPESGHALVELCFFLRACRKAVHQRQTNGERRQRQFDAGNVAQTSRLIKSNKGTAAYSRTVWIWCSSAS